MCDGGQLKEGSMNTLNLIVLRNQISVRKGQWKSLARPDAYRLHAVSTICACIFYRGWAWFSSCMRKWVTVVAIENHLLPTEKYIREWEAEDNSQSRLWHKACVITIFCAWSYSAIWLGSCRPLTKEHSSRICRSDGAPASSQCSGPPPYCHFNDRL